MANPRLTIIHGYTASAQSHWFPWLKGRMEQHGVAVDILSMPDSNRPQPERWIEHIRQHTAEPDARQFFVAHSLGCIALLRTLQTLPPSQSIGGMILVAGFANRLDNLPELDGFNSQPLDGHAIIQRVAQRLVIASSNDSVVDPRHSLELSRLIDAPLIRIDHAGHFLASDGFVQFAEIDQALQTMLAARA